MPYPLKSDLISELWAALQPIYNDTHEMGQNPSMITVDRVSIRAGHPGNNIKWAPSRNHAEQVTVTAPAAMKRSGYWGDKTWTFQVDTATATANIKGIVAAVGKALEALEAADVAKIEQAKQAEASRKMEAMRQKTRSDMVEQLQSSERLSWKEYGHNVVDLGERKASVTVDQVGVVHLDVPFRSVPELLEAIEMFRSLKETKDILAKHAAPAPEKPVCLIDREDGR